MQSQSHWYRADEDNACLDPAHQAFKEAVGIFSSTLTKDSHKIAAVQQATSLGDLEDAVINAKARYDSAHQNRKVSKWLSKFSCRVQFYGNIMDVLVQQHPEYVSLAWGAMKFLFVLVVNHEAMIKSLAKGLCQIADSLPRIEFATVLYPTMRMKQAVAELYAHIIKFLIRARDWYKENKFMHVVHSFTRPVELRYADLISEIDACTQTVDKLSSAGAQAEQRDMHLKMQEMIRIQNESEKRQRESDAVLLEMRHLMITYQAVNSSAHLDTNQRLSDLQVSSIMSFTSGACKMDAVKSLQYCTFMRNRYLSRLVSAPEPFWLSSKFRAWKSMPASSLVIIKGNYISRFEVKDFCVSAINLLRDSKIPVLWALKTKEQGALEAPSVIDLLKDLVSQALRLNIALHNERSLALSCTQFQGAETEKNWFELLARVLAGLPQVYIIIDVEAVSPYFGGHDHTFSWPSAFLDFFQNMSEQGCKTLIKVVLVSYGSVASLEMSRKDSRSVVIPVGRPQTTPLAVRGKLTLKQRGAGPIGRGRGRGRTRGLAFT